MDLTWTGIAAGLSLMWPQSTPLNQSRLLMSSIHWSLWSRSSQNLHTSSEREVTWQPLISPHYSLTSCLGYRNLWGKLQCTLPVHHFPIRFLGRLWAERRVAYQHLEHDDPQGPPVARLVVASLEEHLWSNVVRGTHCRVSQSSPLTLPRLRLPLGVHRIGGEVRGFDLVEISVEFCPVRFLQSRAKTKVREFNMATRVKEKVVRLDVPVKWMILDLFLFNCWFQATENYREQWTGLEECHEERKFLRMFSVSLA